MFLKLRVQKYETLLNISFPYWLKLSVIYYELVKKSKFTECEYAPGTTVQILDKII